MKKETYLQKMAALFDDVDLPPEILAPEKIGTKANPLDIAIKEEEIARFRARQGLVYFLLAPELFFPRTCRKCEAPFLVSRKQVAYCSYNCLQHDIKDNFGIRWERMDNMELTVKEVWDGNEPLWVNNLDQIQQLVDDAKALLPQPTA